MKKILFFVIASFLSCSCHSQKYVSFISESKQKKIINILLENKDKAEFPFIYDKLTDSSSVVEVFFAFIENNENVSFNTDFTNYLVVDTGMHNYLIYNKLVSECVVLGNYNTNEDPSQMFVEPGNQNLYLNRIIDKISNLKDVSILRLNGVSGYCVLYKNKIWVIEGDEWTDINSFFKKNYTLNQLKDIVLIKREWWH